MIAKKRSLRFVQSQYVLSSFERVRAISTAMRPLEWRVAKNYLRLMNKQSTPHALELLLLLEKKPNISETEARSAYPFNQLQDGAFEVIVTKLKEKLIFSLALDVNTRNKEFYSESWRARFEVKSKLASLEALKVLGLSAEVLYLLEDIIRTSKKFELYDELTSALQTKRRFFHLRIDDNEINELDSEIEFANKCSKAVTRAAWIAECFSTEHKKNGQRIVSKTYTKEINELNNLYLQTQSQQVLYNKMIVEVAIEQENGNYDRAHKFLEKLLALITKSKICNSKARLGTVYINLAQNFIHLMEFEQSIVFIAKGRELFEKNSLNFALTEELEFYVRFYTGDFEQAEFIIRKLIAAKYYKNTGYLENKKHYLLACTLFAQGKYDEAETEIRSITQITRDKTGWYIGIQIMSLLLCRLKNDYEMMSIERTRFNLNLDRLRHRVNVRKRDITIFRIIKEFLKGDGSFKGVFQKRESDIMKLSSNDPDYCWQIYSHEMIPFHYWLEDMAQRKKYGGLRIKFKDNSAIKSA